MAASRRQLSVNSAFSHDAIFPSRLNSRRAEVLFHLAFSAANSSVHLRPGLPPAITHASTQFWSLSHRHPSPAAPAATCGASTKADVGSKGRCVTWRRLSVAPSINGRLLKSNFFHITTHSSPHFHFSRAELGWRRIWRPIKQP